MLGPDITTALQIIGNILQVAGSVDAGDDNSFQQDEKQIDDLITNLQGLVTTCNRLLGQTGQVAVGPATPTPPAVDATGSTAVSTALHSTWTSIINSPALANRC
jgi:hypothetical protein